MYDLIGTFTVLESIISSVQNAPIELSVHMSWIQAEIRNLTWFLEAICRRSAEAGVWGLRRNLKGCQSQHEVYDNWCIARVASVKTQKRATTACLKLDGRAPLDHALCSIMACTLATIHFQHYQLTGSMYLSEGLLWHKSGHGHKMLFWWRCLHCSERTWIKKHLRMKKVTILVACLPQ